MGKLLVDKKMLYYEEGSKYQRIHWHYISKLNNMQEERGFSLANKLKMIHIMYAKHKVN